MIRFVLQCARLLKFWCSGSSYLTEQHEHPGCEIQVEGRTDKGSGKERALPQEKGERILTVQIVKASRTPTEGKEEKFS
jgi:hypothetical protein